MVSCREKRHREIATITDNEIRQALTMQNFLWKDNKCANLTSRKIHFVQSDYHSPVLKLRLLHNENVNIDHIISKPAVF